jgi:hypothetical protein
VQKIIVGAGKPPVAISYAANFQIITNVATYGPFGTSATGHLSSYTVPKDKTLVGFAAFTDTEFRTLDVYVI